MKRISRFFLIFSSTLLLSCFAWGCNSTHETMEEYSDPFDTLAELADEEQNVSGNSHGNIDNGGKVAKQGRWIYYSNPADGAKIYKIHEDGTGKTRVNENPSSFINVVGDWIYYSSAGNLCRVKTDGTNKEKLSEGGCQNIQVVGDWIYYNLFKNEDDSTLYRIRTDGSEKKQLTDQVSIFSFCVTDEWLYFCTWDSGELYKMKKDGTGKTVLIEGPISCFSIVDEYIYYIGFSEPTDIAGNKVKKVDVEGGSIEELFVFDDKKISNLNVTPEWIYLVANDFEETASLYKIRKDGNDKKFLSVCESISRLNVVGNWLYFYCSENALGEYKLININDILNNN